ncbi:Assimilatory nitrite reductase [NAD(P)H] small subunit [archaeon HR06]|nr:Assimilatory nitrite reductase [NAD(P)H] small subunit [archaeon HR06]
MGKLIKVGSVKDIPLNTGKVIDLGDKSIALFNVNGNFYAISNVCLHRGGPLGEGELEGNIVTCPWHGWQYNVITGENVDDPELKLETYKVLVEGESLYVEI